MLAHGKGKPFGVCKTPGISKGDGDLFNIVGLSKGKLLLIINCLEERKTTGFWSLAHEMLSLMKRDLEGEIF